MILNFFLFNLAVIVTVDKRVKGPKTPPAP